MLAGTPALATQGLRCAPAAESGPSLILTIGHGADRPIVAATLVEGSVTRATAGEGPMLAVAQSRIDGQRLWLDLTDRDAKRSEATLRARFDPSQRGRSAIGTLERNGRSYAIRCVED
jgi:hypothetical protein